MPGRNDGPWRKLREGNVVLKIRKGSSYWQAHLKVDGEWIRLSTGKTDIRDATAQYIQDLESRNLASADEYRRTIKKWIDPHLGGKKLDEISPQDIVGRNACLSKPDVIPVDNVLCTDAFQGGGQKVSGHHFALVALRSSILPSGFHCREKGSLP